MKPNQTPSQPSPSSKKSATPAMRQYLEAKKQYQDAIVFFRMGDFYEMFYEDALTASRTLEITLTSRSKDSRGGSIPMCGVPYHAADSYLARLVKKGFRVAICEQMEDAKKAKGIVRREVVRVVSPGTLTDTQQLDAREPSYLLSINRVPHTDKHRNTTKDSNSASVLGVALLDLSTGEFSVAEYLGETGRQAFEDELAILRPREIVVPNNLNAHEMFPSLMTNEVSITTIEPWNFELETAKSVLLDQLKASHLDGYGLEDHPAATAAAGGLIQHLRETQKADLAHIRTVNFKKLADSLLLDPTTLRHLELIETINGEKSGSLLRQVDHTVTAMGGRQLRKWVLRPLLSLERVQDRLDGVEELAFSVTERGKCRETLKSVQDIERLVARAALGIAGPRDLSSLGHSLSAIPKIRSILQNLQAPLIQSLLSELDDLTDVREKIEATLINEPPTLAREGGFTREGVDAELDELRDISRSGKQHIADMEESERKKTGVASLKIRYNRVFGYYIEISKANLHAVPEHYHRKQTVASGERYITQDLKEYENKILGADERITTREIEIFEALRTSIGTEAPRIQQSSHALASLDSLAALADVATTYDYTKPQLHSGDELTIRDGRHPVVERHVADAFVPNDIELNTETSQLVILTGPNMGGKSTYLRQIALISILAQAGSFVPARHAKLPIVDRVFARVGASDNIARGQSTFMVEMQETANILHSATSQSLVLLDEIGRGTATFDGLSIAWAVAEYIATNTHARPKTLFATHYHELTDLADSLPGVVNYHVVAKEWQDEITFLRKVIAGRSDRSYGIQVARLAGLPPVVITRASEILSSLEQDELTRSGRPALSGQAIAEQNQPGLFEAAVVQNQLASRLRNIDLDRITPLEALALLAKLKEDVQE